MNKRLLALLSVPLILSLGGCGEKPHEHTFSDAWDHNATSHWHPATCEHTDLKGNEAVHTGGEATYTHGKICDVCGFEYTAPKEKDVTLIGKLYNYNGKSSELIYDRDTTEADFNDVFGQFYQSFTQVKLSVADILSSYKVDKHEFKTLYDNQTKFEDKETEKVRLYNGKEIKTYGVNIKDEYKLCEFGFDPDKEDVYHFYSENLEKPGEVEIFKLVDKDFLSGHTKNATVYDDGFILENNEVKFTFVIQLTYEGAVYKASFNMYLASEAKQEVTITKQPEDVEICAPDGFKFEVQVDHPELVRGYQWYGGGFNEAGEPASFSPILGTAAKKRVFEVPATGSKTGRQAYKCLITTDDSQFFSDVAVLDISESLDEVPAFMVLDYAVRPGSYLNLEDTPYGTGEIRYSGNGSEIAFDNVHFNNANIESALENIAFDMTSWHNIVENVNIKFIGTNVINNVYWEEDHNQGGFGFFMHYGGESVIPTITFTGDPVTIIGGTRAISVNAHLVIENEINCVGLPHRLTHGIYAYDFVVKSGAAITGSMGGSILYTTHAEANIWGDIKIEKGARIDAIINPGHVSEGDTQLFGMLAINDLIIDGAEVNMTIAPDYAYFRSSDHAMAPIIGMYSQEHLIKITNSNVNINVICQNVPTEGDIFPLVACAEGISSPNIQILDNSNVNVYIDSSAFNQVCGIYGIVINLFNSDVDVHAHGAYYVSGINAVLKRTIQVNNLEEQYIGKCYGNDCFDYANPLTASFEEIGSQNEGILRDPGDFVSTIKINEGRTRVYAKADTFITGEPSDIPTYVDAGMRAKDFKITLNGASSIEIDTEGMSAMVLTYDHIQDYLEPVADYSSAYLDQVLDVFASDVTYHVNQGSYESYSELEEPKHFYVAYESLFADNLGENFLTHIKLTHKA